MNLLLVCLNAFVAVLVLLSIFALVIRGLTALFPDTAAAPVAATRPTPSAQRPKASSKNDAAMVAAIDATAATLFPGGRVTQIEETTGKHS